MFPIFDICAFFAFRKYKCLSQKQQKFERRQKAIIRPLARVDKPIYLSIYLSSVPSSFRVEKTNQRLPPNMSNGVVIIVLIYVVVVAEIFQNLYQMQRSILTAVSIAQTPGTSYIRGTTLLLPLSQYSL